MIFRQNNKNELNSKKPQHKQSQNNLVISTNSSNVKPIPIKVYAKCLRSDIEYKTLSVTSETTSKDLIWMLLSKYRMKHRDPKLFYLTIDISMKRTEAPLKRSLPLDDDTKPVELKSCHPWGECKFTLQMRKGGVIRIYDSVLMAESKYKCLLVSSSTTVEDVIGMLFHCYGLDQSESTDRFCIFEHNPSKEYERRLSSDDKPIQVQATWANPSHFMFVLRRSPLTTTTVDMFQEEDAVAAADCASSSSEFSALRFDRDSSESTR